MLRTVMRKGPRVLKLSSLGFRAQGENCDGAGRPYLCIIALSGRATPETITPARGSRYERKDNG